MNEIKVDIFLEVSCFIYDPVNVGNLTFGSSAFSNPCLNIWVFSVLIMWKPSLEDVEHNLNSMGVGE